MQRQWFVVHTLSGHEKKVKESIEKHVVIEELGELVGDVLIPMEKVSEVKQGKRSTVNRKFFPGYILVDIALKEDGNTIDERVWHFINETNGVIGFLGGQKPKALSQPEVDSIFGQMEDKKERVKPKVAFEPGETVEIVDGPFQSFSGMVEEVDPERGKLKVSVAIFGRTTPVELEYWQVERGE
jgi:transcription termination/antitermination protein NusG